MKAYKEASAKVVGPVLYLCRLSKLLTVIAKKMRIRDRKINTMNNFDQVEAIMMIQVKKVLARKLASKLCGIYVYLKMDDIITKHRNILQ